MSVKRSKPLHLYICKENRLNTFDLHFFSNIIIIAKLIVLTVNLVNAYLKQTKIIVITFVTNVSLNKWC